MRQNSLMRLSATVLFEEGLLLHQQGDLAGANGRYQAALALVPFVSEDHYVRTRDSIDARLR